MRALAAACLGSSGLAVQGVVAPTPAVAACEVRPIVRDYTVSQGLSTYVDLARGKDTLVRFFLSMPSCAPTGAAIQLVSAKLDVRAGTVTHPRIERPVSALVWPFPRLSGYAGAPAADSTADPRFLIPGALLAPSAQPSPMT